MVWSPAWIPAARFFVGEEQPELFCWDLGGSPGHRSFAGLRMTMGEGEYREEDGCPIIDVEHD